VRIRAPGDGKFFSAAETVEFRVEASDPEAALDENDVVWRSNKDGTIGRGFKLRTDRLSEGQHQVTCTVTDKHGASADDSVRVLITNEAPTARILGPSSGTTVRYSDTLVCEGQGDDAEDGALDGDRLEWTAVKVETGKSRRLGTGRHLSEKVHHIAEELGFGRFDLRLVATDRDGKASPAVTVAVTLENRAPTVHVGNPVDGASVAQGAELLCSGYGNDPDRGRLLEGAELVWRARRLDDGTERQLGTGTRLGVADLAPGAWELVLVGIDPDDQSLRARAAVRVTVTPAPTGTPDAGTPTTTSVDPVAPDTTGINAVVGQ
jgi:hypothetical protein